jgi:xylitol oxidase
MKKRTFLKLTSAVMTGMALSPLTSCAVKEKSERIKNWAGNLTYSTDTVFEPTTTEEVRQIIKDNSKLRALGSRHCFNRIADSEAALLSTLGLNSISAVDKQKNTVKVGSGIRYGELCTFLDEQGYALHNLASLPHISVAGACATATHGSGVGNGNLATAVSALEFANGAGELVSLSRETDPATFYGAVVNLGALGVVTSVTLDLIPTFQVRQNVYLDLPMPQLEEHFDEIMSAGYSVSLFTDWQTTNINQVWIKRVVNPEEEFTPDPEFFGATMATRNVHPIIEISAENCTEQMGVPGPWYDRLPHFKMGFTPSSGEELQAEFFVPREKAVEAIKAIATLGPDLKPYLMITEIRTIDSDELWMSPCYQQPSVAIHFTLKQDIEGVNGLLPKIEEKLTPFGVKPHWGKLFTISPAVLQARYPKLADFKALIKEYDSDGKFMNDFITQNIF